MKKIFVSLALLLFPVIMFARGPSGHMTGGAIAYYYLKKHNPQVLDKVLASFEKHPWFDNKWNEKMSGMSTEQKKVALFMLASTYPDDIKNPHIPGDAERRMWHYIDYPFVPEGETITPEEPKNPNAQEKIDSFLIALKGANESQDKAIGLCWVFHLIEDIHQPLHTSSLFSAEHPHGDKGGNDTYILLSANAQPTKLHGYWDGLIKGTINTIPANAQTLLQSSKYKESNLHELTNNITVEDWIKKESFELAKTKVYKNGTVSGSQINPTVVDQQYVNNAKTTAEKRVVLSGIRLAKKLIEIYS